MSHAKVVIALVALSFAGCGSSGGGGGGEDTCPAGTTLRVFAPSTTLTAGGPQVEIAGGLSNGCQVMVNFTLSGPGTLSPTSGIPVYYTPPASVATVSTATVTATAAGLTDTIVFTVYPVGSTVWTGTAVGSSGISFTSGSLSLTFASAVPAPVVGWGASSEGVLAAATVGVTGTFTSRGFTVGLTGTYDPTTRTFTGGATATGLVISLTGSVSAAAITGTFTVVFGGTTYPGTFTASPGGSGTVTVYCGTYAGTSTGTWNLVVSGASLSGIASTSSGNVPLAGSVSGSAMTITFPSGLPVPGTATGTISGSGVTGTWQITGAGESGTFSGTTGC